MGGLTPPVLCKLDDQGGGNFNAQSGTLVLELKAHSGVTNFDCALCTVWDASATPRTQLSSPTVQCTSTQFTFIIPKPNPAGLAKKYRVQLAFKQVPAFSSVADLMETPCNNVITQIDAGRLALHWHLTVQQ